MDCLKYSTQSLANRVFLMKFGNELKISKEKDLTSSFRIFIMECAKTERTAILWSLSVSLQSWLKRMMTIKQDQLMDQDGRDFQVLLSTWTLRTGSRLILETWKLLWLQMQLLKQTSKHSNQNLPCSNFQKMNWLSKCQNHKVLNYNLIQVFSN